MTTTQIYSSYREWLARPDKTENGVSVDFAHRHPGYDASCTDCVGCWNCAGCIRCVRCVDCADCVRCRDCTDCIGCWDCADCEAEVDHTSKGGL